MLHYSALKINMTTLAFLEGVCCLAAYGKIGLENEQSLSIKPISFYQSTHQGYIVSKGIENRFHFTVRLYADNAQMTSKHGKNKEVRHEPQASSVTDVLTMF